MKQIENLLVAQAMVMDLPREKLVNQLCCWRTHEPHGGGDFLVERDADVDDETLLKGCGSAACFGGWVAVHPHFRKLGVYPHEEGWPVLDDKDDPVSVSEELFGDTAMFRPNCSGVPDKKEVLRRIEVALEDRIRELEWLS